MVRGKQTARKSSGIQIPIRRPEPQVTTTSKRLPKKDPSSSPLPDVNVDVGRYFETVAKMKTRNDAEFLTQCFVSGEDWAKLMASPLTSLTSGAFQNFAMAASYITPVMGESSQEVRDRHIKLFKSSFGSALLLLQAASSMAPFMVEENSKD